MRIWIGVLAITTGLTAIPLAANAQVTISNMFGVPVFVTNTPVAGMNSRTGFTPSLGAASASPAMNPSGIQPAMPSPPRPAVIPQSPGAAIALTPPSTAIGQQGSGTAIGQQGGTAIGQQGTTAIGQQGTTAPGQQGFGASIIPNGNAIVIGQPEPFTPAVPAQVPPTGFGGTNHFGQSTMTTPSGALTNAPPRPAITPTTPQTSPMRPAPRRR